MAEDNILKIEDNLLNEYFRESGFRPSKDLEVYLGYGFLANPDKFEESIKGYGNFKKFLDQEDIFFCDDKIPDLYTNARIISNPENQVGISLVCNVGPSDKVCKQSLDDFFRNVSHNILAYTVDGTLIKIPIYNFLRLKTTSKDVVQYPLSDSLRTVVLHTVSDYMGLCNGKSLEKMLTDINVKESYNREPIRIPKSALIMFTDEITSKKDLKKIVKEYRGL